MSKLEAPHFPSLFFLVLILCGRAHGRLVSDDESYSSSSADLVSDGVHLHQDLSEQPIYLRLNPSSTCEQSYGFLPCTTTVLGNLFLILVYGYIMFRAALYLSNGSELLLEILGPGLVGGLFLPMLGSLPDAMIILASGLSGSTESAQSQVSVGIGLLAGSTVLLLTIMWGTCIVVGKCDIEDSVAIDLKDTRGFSLTGSGVSTDIWTSYAARIMAISVLPFLIVQLPQLINSTSGRHLAVLIALIVSVSLLISYCLYQQMARLRCLCGVTAPHSRVLRLFGQLHWRGRAMLSVFQPWIQKRRLEYVKHKHVISGILRHLRTHALGRLHDDEGEPNEDVIKKLFQKIDENNDGHLSAAEIRALIIGIQFEDINLDKDDAVEKVMKDFDASSDSHVDERKFVDGICRWLNEAKRSADISTDPLHRTMKFLTDFHTRTKQEHALLGVDDQSDEDVEGVQNAKYWTTVKAVLLLLLGTAIVAAVANPLVDAVDNFSRATSIPMFFISFIVLPLASSSSDAVSAVIFAKKKKKRNSSLTFSQIYGAVTMTNVLCLSVFLAVIYIRGLTWNFSSEVLVIFIVCTIMGLFASFRTTFPLWTSSVAFLLYPLSIALVYVLDYSFGWS